MRSLDGRELRSCAAVILAALVLITAPPARAVMDATTECLSSFDGVPAGDEDGGTITCTDCDAACDQDGVAQANGSCTFKLAVCLNQSTATCPAGTIKKSKVKPKKAGLTGAEPCGPMTSVTVKTKNHGKKKGMLVINALAKTGAPARVDKDKLILICNPLGSGASCATTTTTTTTTTTFPTNVSCEPIVPGQPIPNTYQMQSISGPKLCHTGSAANRFGPCTTDADCGNTAGACLQTPWVTAGAIPQPLAVGSSTVFTIAAAGAAPTCEHAACIGCGNPNATCTGITGGCGDPANNCIKTTCCDAPKLNIPAILIAAISTCVRVDQVSCGVGVVNTSNPQVGDNEVNKSGDTSDPGPDCQYGTADDPAPLACNVVGAGADTKGKVVRTLGNGSFDPAGIHFRFVTPELSTAWSGDNAGCPSTATFDAGETLLTQLVLQAEPSTAGATGKFEDMNGDSCKRAGGGFAGSPGDGPVTVGPPTVSPMPYGGGDSVSVAIGPVFSGGGSPLKDLGFVAITPNAAPTIIAPEACDCVPVPGCPE